MHEHYMRIALAQARRGMGRVSPNPMVGAVVVRIDAAMDAAKPLLHPETASTPPRPAGRQLGSISRRPRPGLKNAHTATDRRLLGSDHDHGPDRRR